MFLINYYTVNTNQSSVIYSKEMEHNKYARVQDIIRKARNNEGVDLEDNINLKLHVNEDYYMGKLSLRYKTNYVPLLITGGTRFDKNHPFVWNEIIRIKEMLFPLCDDDMIPPSTPYIIDMVAPSLYNQLEIVQLTKDLTTNIGCILLSRDSK